jgi:hypothetical protein
MQGALMQPASAVAFAVPTMTTLTMFLCFLSSILYLTYLTDADAGIINAACSVVATA